MLLILQIIWLDNVTACFRKYEVRKVTKDFRRWLSLSFSTFECWKGGQRTFCVDFVIGIYCHFRRCAKRKKQLKEFINFNNGEVRKAINHVSTRRLGLEKCLVRTLMQWDSWESYFLFNFNLDDDPAGNDPDEKPSREKWLVNAFKQPISKLYSMFVQSVISEFDSFNTFLQAEVPLTHILYYSTLRLYRSLLSRFILSEVIS